MTRMQEIRLNALVLTTCGFGALYIDSIWSITRDRAALLAAASRAMGLFLLAFPLVFVSFALTFLFALFVPTLKSQISSDYLALAGFALLGMPFWLPFLLGLYTLAVVAHGSAERNRVLRFLGWFGGRFAAYLMERQNLMWPRFLKVGDRSAHAGTQVMNAQSDD